MYGAYLWQAFLVVLAETEVSESLVQDSLHLLLVIDTTAGVVEETFVECDACILVPPYRVEHDVDGKRLAANLYHTVMVFHGGRRMFLGSGLFVGWMPDGIMRVGVCQLYLAFIVCDGARAYSSCLISAC